MMARSTSSFPTTWAKAKQSPKAPQVTFPSWMNNPAAECLEKPRDSNIAGAFLAQYALCACKLYEENYERHVGTAITWLMPSVLANHPTDFLVGDWCNHSCNHSHRHARLTGRDFTVYIHVLYLRGP